MMSTKDEQQLLQTSDVGSDNIGLQQQTTVFSNSVVDAEQEDKEFYGDIRPKTVQPTAQASPGVQSSGSRLLYYAGSPGRYIKTKIAPGSVNSSIFSLVIICLGAGTLTIPYVFYELGFTLGTISIIFGGSISAFCAYLLAYCAHHTKATSFEEIALVTFGKRGQYLTTFCMVLCNIGFTVSYIITFKSFLPYAIETTIGKPLPAWCTYQTMQGQAIWGILFSFLIVFPLSIPRELKSLRFTSAFSVMVSFYIVLVIFFEAVLNHGTSPSVKAGFSAAHDQINLSARSFFNSLPLIIFAFMYQINVPAIYTELKVQTLPNAKKVIIMGTSFASVLYIVAGIFGWISFSAGVSPEKYKEIFDAQNILRAPYATSDGSFPVAVYVCLYGITLVVAFASPFCVLPTKDSIEAMLGYKLNHKQNLMWTFIIIAVSCAVATPVLTIGTAMVILGATTNSAIGFLLPIAFYLKHERKTPRYSNDKIACYVLFVFICFSSVAELTTFTLKEVNGSGDKS